jgi:psiF repeat
MKHTTWLAALGTALALAAGQAAIGQATQNSQQSKMTSCNADATSKGLKGDDRKAFMKTCLSNKGAATTGNSQQEKMKSCNKDASAKGLKGDDRKAFMKSCLSGSASAQ